MSVIDGATNSVTDTIAGVGVGKAPEMLDVDPNTGNVYVADFDSDTVTRSTANPQPAM